jgi:hypothetical protein
LDSSHINDSLPNEVDHPHMTKERRKTHPNPIIHPSSDSVASNKEDASKQVPAVVKPTVQALKSKSHLTRLWRRKTTDKSKFYREKSSIIPETISLE